MDIGPAGSRQGIEITSKREFKLLLVVGLQAKLNPSDKSALRTSHVVQNLLWKSIEAYFPSVMCGHVPFGEGLSEQTLKYAK